jgi:hypothetical protein
MNAFQRSEILLRSEILEVVGDAYGWKHAASLACSARRQKTYRAAIAKITESESEIRKKKYAQLLPSLGKTLISIPVKIEKKIGKKIEKRLIKRKKRHLKK